MAVVISELMAANQTTIADNDGDYSDWIELRNDGPSAVNLSGYFLTDDAQDLTKWRMPSTNLANGQHLLIWASGKDRDTAGQPLHTNFKLANEGEYLGLVKPDGVTVEFAYAPTFPTQADDVSYGLSANGSQRGYFPAATPGTANGAPLPDASRAVVISEIMYSLPRTSLIDDEETQLEFIELTNHGPQTVNLQGWQITSGVGFTFPNVPIPSNGQLVVAADVTAFQAAYPGIANVVGGWQGTLSNNGERIEITDNLGSVIDRVDYASEGDWSQRAVGPLDRNHRGWIWSSLHDGGGHSLELVNLSMTNDAGQNWATSASPGGTPGRANSANSTNIAPLIADALHSPAIPHSNQAVLVTAQFSDELTQGVAGELFWRVAGQGNFQSLPMFDDGAHSDGSANDGLFTGTIPAQANNTVIEYYVRATDNSSRSRTWPAPTTDGSQSTNALYQVLDSQSQEPLAPGAAPIFHTIMTPAERAEFDGIPGGSQERLTDAQFHATFIAVTGLGVDVRYNAGVRFRGSASRFDAVTNNRISLPADQPWQGIADINVNSVAPDHQIVGSAMFRLAGVGVSDVHAVRLIGNGTDRKNGGYYVYQEPLNSDFADNHFANDPNGNLYRGRRTDESPPGGLNAGLAYHGFSLPPASAANIAALNSGQLTPAMRQSFAAGGETLTNAATVSVEVANERWTVTDGTRILGIYVYEGQLFGFNPTPYTSYIKNTNSGEADWSDVDKLSYAMSASPNATYVRDIRANLNVEQSFRGMAMNTLIGNNEFGLFTGDATGDDYAMYRGGTDTRFELLPYDWDSLFNNVNGSIFSANNVPALRRLLEHPEFRPIYYAQLLDLIDNVILTDTAKETLRSALTGLVSPARINTIETFLRDRANYVKTLINTDLTVQSNLPVSNGLPQSTSGQVTLNGLHPEATTRAVRVNGQPAVLDGQGNWQYGSTQNVGTTLFDFGATWRYNDTGANLGTAWREVNYNDSSWSSGPSQLGYGDGDEATVVDFGGDPAERYITTYFRSEFQVNDLSKITGLVARLLYDDGAAVYLNGVEVLRANLPADAGADVTAIDPRFQDVENTIETFTLPPAALSALRLGRNVLAAEIHQQAIDSNDIGFNLAIDALETQTGPGTLRPDINRLTVTAHSDLAGQSEPLITKTIDVWYNDGNETNVTGTLSGANVWTAANGPYRIQGDVTLAAGATLSIGPGTTVFFDQDARLTVRGQLTAVGLPGQEVRFTRRPGANTWRGIQFVGSTQDNRIEYAILEYGITNDGMIGLQDSKLTVESSIFDHSDRRRIRSSNSSLVVRNSVFETIFAPGVQPTTDNLSEHIWGGGIPTGGQFLIEGNRFGHITGHNDSIDFDAPRNTGIYAMILNNVFEGGGDDALDMTGDVYIEGNIFRNFIKDTFNQDPGNSNTISSSAGDFWLVRNVFENLQHTTIVKETAFSHYLYNTVISTQFEPIYFDLPGQTSGPGRGAEVVGTVFNTPGPTFGAVLPTTQLTVRNSVLPASEAALYPGNGNLFGTAHVAGQDGDYRLLPGSPAIAGGPGGTMLGASVPAGAILGQLPPPVTSRRDATIVVTGPGITEYRYQLDAGPLSNPIPVAQPIQLSNLTNGEHQLRVYGRNGIGIWQIEPTVSPVWRVDPAAVSVRINEVLAKNVNALPIGNHTPDAVELYNAGATPLLLAGYSISDSPNSPTPFVFPAGTTISAGGYLVLQGGDSAATPLLDVGFGLSDEGDGLYLFNAQGQLIDSVTFGNQLADYSIGRVDRPLENANGEDALWALNVPTLGSANRLAPVGDATSLSINEWYSSGSVRVADDFLELYNSSDLPVELSGLGLTDKPHAFPHLWTIPALSFISGQGFVAFTADDHPERGPTHAGFRLGPLDEHVALTDVNGEFLDDVLYYPQTSEWSQGRTPDGSTNLSFRELPTPNATNGGDTSQTITVMNLGWNAEWKHRSNVDLGTSWKAVDFDDSSWPSDQGPLGVENEALAVPLKTNLTLGGITFYFRTSIDLDRDPSNVQFRIQTQIDDGAIIYVNGEEVTRIGMPNGDVQSSTVANRNVNEAQLEGPFTIPSSFFKQGKNVIAVEVHQTASNSSDIVFGAELLGTQELVTTDNNRQLLLDQLRISEVMYQPANGNAPEYIELQNIGTTTLDLSGVRLDGGVSFTFPLGVQLTAGQYIVIAEDTNQFLATYGNGAALAGQYSGSLNDAGDSIVLKFAEPLETAILNFEYDPAWYPTTAGQGRALEPVDPAQDFRLWSEASSWKAGAPNGTPGYGTQAPPATQRIVINEALSNAPSPLEDSIELFNAGNTAINVGGWILSNRADLAQGFRIPAGTTIPAGSYRVFRQTDFDQQPYHSPGFHLDDFRDNQLWLWRADENGQPHAIVDAVELKSSASGESWGRTPNGTGLFAPQTSRTLGSANSGVRVGPLVISEINYHPANPSAAALQQFAGMKDDDLEFIEIFNPTSQSVDLTNWRISGADYHFPAGQRLGAQQTLLVLSFNPSLPANVARTAAFRTHYGISNSVALVGGYDGVLDNGGDTVRLLRPGSSSPLDEPLYIPGLVEDQITYDDQAPWPTAADGGGSSLTRTLPAAWGVLATSWTATIPSPGQAGSGNLPGDFNGDRVVEFADIQLLCQGMNTVRPDLNLTGDTRIDFADLTFLIQNIMGSTFGDANLDGRFNSADLVQVFVTGEYEDAITGNSTWADGDWNCDGEFSTQDLVVAFQAGGYIAAASPAATSDSGPGEVANDRVVDWSELAFALARDARATEASSDEVDAFFSEFE